MKALLISAPVIVLLLNFPNATRAQNVEVLQYTADTAPISQCDPNRNTSQTYWHPRYLKNETVCAEGSAGADSEFHANQCCQSVIWGTKEPARAQFVYKLTLTNRGPRTIREVQWEYIFLDRETQTEVARHQFISDEKISPGKRKSLIAHSSSPPVKVVHIRLLSRPETERFIETVRILRVGYEDGSVWEPQRDQGVKVSQ